MKYVEWMPSVDQVATTLPHAFKTKYPLTFAIIDGSEVFSSNHQHGVATYKHHNTAKVLLACTQNGAVSLHFTIVCWVYIRR